MRIITTHRELDEMLAECDRAAQTSDDELRRVFQTFRMELSERLPSDPFSAEYTRSQFALYERIAGRPYNVRYEETIGFDPEEALVRPFPFTASCQVAGLHLGAIAFLLRNIHLPAGARVLDVGPGWGNTTLALAQLGFDVTALDIEPRFCELIRERTRRAGVQVEVVNSDFFWIETVANRFDAILFFESFHHCADHMRLLRSLGRALTPGGHVYFGAEPITPTLLKPWGIRTEGEALWAIRRHGWLELGFHTDYFRRALCQAGLTAEMHSSADVPWIAVWDAKTCEPETTMVDPSEARGVARTRIRRSPFNLVRDARNLPAVRTASRLTERILKGTLHQIMPVVARHPHLAAAARGVLKPFPWFTARLHRLAGTSGSPTGLLGRPAADTDATGDSETRCFKTRRDSDNRAFIADVYHGLLGRDPDEIGMRLFRGRLKNGDLDRAGLIHSILASEEFNNRAQGGALNRGNEPHGCLRSEARALFERFQRYQGAGRSGFVTNFLGGLTDVRFVREIESLSGAVEGYPIPGNFHGDTLEWVGTLRSVLEARGTFTMLELGAGWAPWCVIGYLAAKQRGITEIKLIAIEADAGHIRFIQENFATNGIDRDVGEIIHGVVGVTDGEALFPKARDASRVYGGCAAFSKTEQTEGVFADFAASQAALVEEVGRLPCFSLTTLMQRLDQIDLVHCDIQGGEVGLFGAMIEPVSDKVKRVVVGTHSFEIDRHLCCLFAKYDWILEGINACLMIEHHGKPVLVHDGAQVWRNQRME